MKKKIFAGLIIVSLILWGGVSCKITSEDIPLNWVVDKEQSRMDSLYEAVESVIKETCPGVVCWGDSLTAGGDGTTYPGIIQQDINNVVLSEFDLTYVVNPDLIDYVDINYNLSIPVVNMGVGGENTDTIVGRNGAIPFVISSDLIIPESTVPVEISFSSQNGDQVAPLRQDRDGLKGVNPVTIDGIEGRIEIKQDSPTSSDFSYSFRRSRRGESKGITKGTIIETDASNKYLDYITVIFIGQNGGYSDFEDLIEQQMAIIQHQDRNNDKFIIVGLHTGTAESRAALESAMEAEYGEHYINLREYMATKALSDAEIEPTADDERAMQQGSTPPSLLSDSVHFNAEGYTLIGDLIFEKMMELGFFDDVVKAIEDTITIV